MNPSPTLTRFRVFYNRGHEMRYVSHLDLQLVWERTFRRARLPIAHSQGFTPHPRFHMAAALPLGFTSRCEIIDLWLDVPLPIQQLQDDLQRAAPPGLLIDRITEVPLTLPALQTQVRTAEYEASFPFEGQQEAGKDAPPVPVTRSMVADFLASSSLVRERRGKMYDLRPLVDSLDLLDNGILKMVLAAREGATARPEEVLSALGLDPSQARVERTRLVLVE